MRMVDEWRLGAPSEVDDSHTEGRGERWGRGSVLSMGRGSAVHCCRAAEVGARLWESE